jgi:actin-related protein 5
VRRPRRAPVAHRGAPACRPRQSDRSPAASARPPRLWPTAPVAHLAGTQPAAWRSFFTPYPPPSAHRTMTAPQVHPLKEFDAPGAPEPFYANYREGVPIALDLGTSSFKIGLTNSARPNNVFPTIILRFRDRKAGRLLTLVGSDVFRDAAFKLLIKLPFDGPLITNWDYIEDMLDYSFEHLGVNSTGGVANPVIMTEPPCVPMLQRRNYYELLFETYRVPLVVFGIDLLFAFHANGGRSGLVVGTGHELTHVIPVLNGRGVLLQLKRIDWGGLLALQYCSRSLALKYPYFPAKVTPLHAANIVREHCYVLTDYATELAHYLDMPGLETRDVVLQAPIEPSLLAEKAKKSEEELQRQTAKRKEQGRRLQLQAQEKRLEKLVQKEQELAYYANLRIELEAMPKSQASSRLQQEEFDSMEDFGKYVANLEKSLRKARHEDVGEDEITTYPLVDIADAELTEDQLKEKRKQRLMKANWEARERAKQAKAEEEEEARQRAAADAEWRARDLAGWSDAKRQQRLDLVAQIRERTKTLALLGDRKLQAAQQRMRTLATLADELAPTAARKRRRNANSTIDNDPNDTFGANDDDWNAYRDVLGAQLEEQQRDDLAAVGRLEAELLAHDPTFTQADTYSATQRFDWEHLTLHKFLHGPRESVTVRLELEVDPDELQSHPEVVQRNHQMHFNVERIRIPEILFEPNIAGLDQAGIAEVLEGLLHRRFGGDFAPGGDAHALIGDVFLTGGLVQWPNFAERVVREFTSFLPVGAPLRVRTAADPVVDAWRGMQKWAQSDECRKSYVSKAEYDEMGAEYIKEHGLGNVCLR